MTNSRYTVGGAFNSTVPRQPEVEDFSPGLSGPSMSSTIPVDELVHLDIDTQTIAKDNKAESRLIGRIAELESKQANKDLVIEVYNKLVRHYLADEQLTHAERALEGALGFATKTYGEKHPAVAPILIELAFVNYNLDQFEKAKTFLEPALAIQEKEYGKVSEQAAFVVHKLGRVYEALGRFAEAEKLYLRSVTTYQNTYIEDDSQIIIARTDLARVKRKNK